MYLENRIQNLKLLKDRDIQNRGKKQLRCFPEERKRSSRERQAVVINENNVTSKFVVNTLKEPRPKRPTLRT